MSNVKHMCEECQRERQRFRNAQLQDSPACLELFRLSMAQDRPAADCFYRIFEKEVASYVYRQVETSSCRLSLARVPEIVSDIFTNILRYSVNRAYNPNRSIDPNESRSAIAEADNFARVIGWLQETVRNRVFELCRQEAKSLESQAVSTDHLQETGRDIASASGSDDIIDQLTVHKFVEKHIKEKNNPKKEQQNRIITEWGLLQELPPREILEMAQEWFESIQEVFQAKQRMQRRLLRDPEFVRLYSPRQNSGSITSLAFRLDVAEEFMPKNQDSSPPCLLGEEILFDYINGAASAEFVAAIEQSASCQNEVARLRDKLACLQPYLRQVFCPDSNTLIAFQEKKLTDALAGNEIAKHVARCQACQQEIKMLSAIDTKTRQVRLDEATVEPKPGVVAALQRLISQLVFQPATMAPVPVLGEGSYRTIERSPQIELLVRTSRTASKQGNWMLFGRLRYEGDQPVTQVESIVVQEIGEEDTPEVVTTVDAHGAFTVKGLDEGVYRIRILTANEEIVLHRFQIGDEL